MKASEAASGAKNVEDGQKKRKKKSAGRPKKSTLLQIDGNSKHTAKRKKPSASLLADEPGTGNRQKGRVRGQKRGKDADDKEKDGRNRKKRKKTIASSPSTEATVVKDEDRNKTAKAKKIGRKKAYTTSEADLPSSPTAVPVHDEDDKPKGGNRRRKAQKQSATSPTTKSP